MIITQEQAFFKVKQRMVSAVEAASVCPERTCVINSYYNPCSRIPQGKPSHPASQFGLQEVARW
jgi:hypothetical protein